MTPDYQPVWWVWALPPNRMQLKKKKKKPSEACSRWSCPLEVSLFPVMERVGSYSPDWVLGSVQAAAVNEVFPPLSCWGFWLRVYLASVLSAHVLAWDRTGEYGKEAGPMKPVDSVRSIHTVEMADMVTWLLIPISTLNFFFISLDEQPICRVCTLRNVHPGIIVTADFLHIHITLVSTQLIITRRRPYGSAVKADYYDPIFLFPVRLWPLVANQVITMLMFVVMSVTVNQPIQSVRCEDVLFLPIRQCDLLALI